MLKLTRSAPNVRDGLVKQVQATLDGSAALLFGGKSVRRKGFFFEPTILTHIESDNPAFCEGRPRSAGLSRQG